MNIDLDALRNDVQKHKEEKENRGSNNDYVQMPKEKGTLTLRFLPQAPAGTFGPEPGPFVMKNRIHRVNGRNLSCPKEKAPEHSRKKLIGDCKVCDYLRWLWVESEKEGISEAEAVKMKALYREIKINDRYYFNCIQRNVSQDDGSVVDEGPKILSVGITLYECIMHGIVGDPDVPNDKGLQDVTDFKVGYDFMLIKGVKAGKDAWPDYKKSKFISDQTCPLGEPQQVEEWLDNLHDLKALRILKPQEELDHQLKCHLGLRQDSESDFDPNEYTTSVQSHSAESTAAAVTVTETKPEPEAEAADESEDSSSDSKSLAADDFTARLADIGKKK